MSAHVRPALPADAASVGDFLNRHMNPDIPAATFARILDRSWAGAPPHSGYLAEAGGEIVAFHGAIGSLRQADGCGHRMASFSSLYVRRDHRGQDLGGRMMRRLVAESDVTYTVANPSRRVHALLESCGFRDLDTHRRVWAGGGSPGSGVEILTVPALVSAEATAEERRILADHAGLGIRPALIRGPAGQVLCLLLREDRDGPTLELLHAGDPGILAASIDAAAPALLGPDPEARLRIDERFLDNRPAGGRREPLRHRRMVRPAARPPPDWRIDQLYTETLLLGLRLG